MATALDQGFADRRAESRSVDRRAARADWLAAEMLPHEAWLRSRISRLYPHETDVADIVQDSFVRILEYADPDRVASPLGYLASTATSVVVSRVRRRQVVTIEAIGGLEELDALQLPAEDPLPDRAISARQQWALVREALGGEAKSVQDAVRLRREERLSGAATAAALGLSLSSVDKKLRRAARIMRRALGEDGEPGAASADDGHGRCPE